MQFKEKNRSAGKQYRVQGMSGVDTVITILQDLGSSYSILMTSHTPIGTSETEEILTKELFASCLRTGYLAEVPARMLTIA